MKTKKSIKLALLGVMFLSCYACGDNFDEPSKKVDVNYSSIHKKTVETIYRTIQGYVIYQDESQHYWDGKLVYEIEDGKLKHVYFIGTVDGVDGTYVLYVQSNGQGGIIINLDEEGERSINSGEIIDLTNDIIIDYNLTL